MYSKYEERILLKKQAFLFLVAAFINLCLFVTLLVLFNPIYDTNEDVYILYQLSGGFGSPPTELVHYNYGMHPYLNILIKNLFSYYPGINWYSIVLLVSHYMACCIILFEIIKRNKKVYAFLLYLSLYIIFEARLLLTINFTNSAIILAVAGLLLLFLNDTNRRPSIQQVVLPILILLFASLLRIHVLVPLVGISIPFLFLHPYRKKFITVSLALIVAAGLILTFNLLHESYYKAKIPGWQPEENYRQRIYSFYNHSNLKNPTTWSKWNTEMGIIASGSPIDTNFISSQKLVQMEKDLKVPGTYSPKMSQTKNWFWINNRIFFLMVVILMAISIKTKNLFLVSATSLILITSGLYILNLYAKSLEYLKISCLFLFGLFVVVYFFENNLSKRVAALLNFSTILISIWGTIQLYKADQKNIFQTKLFRLAAQEISKRPNQLFVVTSDTFPLQKFYIFDTPRQFLLRNFLAGEHFLQNIYKPVFAQYGIAQLNELPLHSNVLFWGKRVPALENYLGVVHGREILVSEIMDDFQHGEVRSISFKK